MEIVFMEFFGAPFDAIVRLFAAECETEVRQVVFGAFNCSMTTAVWWIVTVYWQHENPEDPLPEKYPKSGEWRMANGE